MINRTFLAAVLSLFILPAFAEDAKPPQAPPAEPANPTQLFNGKDLTGWDGDPKLWSVKDGAIRGETTPENPAKGNTFLILKDKSFTDFDLRFSFRMNATVNSGVQYRSKHITEGKVGNQWVVRGYQHELRNENKLPNVSGFIYDEGGKRGRICLAGEQAVWESPTAADVEAAKAAKPADAKAKPDAKAAAAIAAGTLGKKKITGHLLSDEEFAKLMKLDEWNDVVIRVQGNHIQHFLNGRLILDFTDSPELLLKEGIMALQLHAGKPMWAEFKNLRIAELK